MLTTRHPVARATGLALVFALASASFPRSALAQPPGQAGPAGAAGAAGADEDKRKGDEASAELRYADAIGFYEKSYATTKNPAVLYNMSRAYQSLADYPKALEKLEEFVEKAPQELKARVPQLDSLLAELRGRVATMIISVPTAGAEIRLGDKILGTTKEGQSVYRVNAGAQTLQISHPSYFTFTRPLALAAGKIETVDVVLGSKDTGSLLTVTSPVAGANVSVDGASLGVVPAQKPLSPGQHRITLQRDGYETAETSVVLTAGETKEVRVPMVVRETIAGKWWFWTGIGVVLAAGGVAIGVALTTEKDSTTGTIPPGTVKAESFGFRF